MAAPDNFTRSPLAADATASSPGQTADSNASTRDEPTPRPELSAPRNDAGRYTIGAEIARGGMGVVYRATDTTLDREVAVKVLQDKFAPESSAARRFIDEARITGQLQHPGIPPVHDLGTLPNGRPFLAMKLYNGQTLEERLQHRTDAAADRGQFVAAFEQVCQAVAYAHAHSVIHRDLKPANIMVGAFGEVQVMDWGLAKVIGSRQATADDPEAMTGTEVRSQRESDGLFTQAGSVLGTPAFMPPEQAMGAVDQIDARSDVFGLGSILCAILTGRPPFVAGSAESARQLAAQGKVANAFARLDACGADPDLVALCKRCLSRDKEDRPADAGEAAKAVADLRAAADERARRAELDRVKAEGEKATAEARAGERRKRRRVWTGAAAAVTLAVVAGLAAVLLVQRLANHDLTAKNSELADEQAKVQARFELAQNAILTFHTGVSEDVMLKQVQFKELQTKLLKEAAGFYAQLEKLLEGQTDARSRRAVGAGYFQLGELTEKIGSQPEALAVHRKALAVRRELAAASGADVEQRLDVARSLSAVGVLLAATGDPAGALAAYEEQRDLAEQLAAEDPTDAVRAVLARSYHKIGKLLSETGKPEEALQSYKKTLAIRQKLADANPAVTEFQSDLARSHNNIGVLLQTTGKPGEALQSYKQALDIRQKLADANPAITEFQSDLAMSHSNIGVQLDNTGKPGEALESYKQALAIRQKLADANAAVTEFQSDLAMSHSNIGALLSDTGKPEEALESYKQALAIQQKLADGNPAVTEFQSDLARSHYNIGALLSDTGKPGEALESYKKALAILQKLADANPAVTAFQSTLAFSHTNIGWLHARQKRFADAFASLDTGGALFQKLLDEHPENTECISGLGYSHAYRGWARVRAGRQAEAASDLLQAVKLWAKHPSLNIDARFERCRALSLLAGLGGDAKSGVTAAEATTFADQAVVALGDAINAGWSQTDELKEPDFGPLRGREDFKNLLADLKAKIGPREKQKD